MVMAGKSVLVVGGGGRCHAIVDALSRSPQVSKIYCAPGNAGIASLAECVAISDTDIAALKAFALDNAVDLTVVGPEAALAKGIADEFTAQGLRIFAPSASAARIESSKEFAKMLMSKYNIPTAGYRSFSDFDQAMAYVDAGTFPVVLKYDGLAAGKGVVIATDRPQAEEALKDMLLDHSFGAAKVVIEEFLEGPEFSFLCFVDGKRVYPMLLSQDHKRAFDNDCGPNTGGMGAYTGLPFIDDADRDYALHSIMEPLAAAMVEEGVPFKGVLYGGLMKCRDGIKVIEFNARFGDPEAEVILPRLRSDAYEIFSAVADSKDLKEVPGFENGILWSDDVTIGVVLASKGYPGHYDKGFAIEGLDTVSPSTKVFHMGTRYSDGAFRTAGGRVLIVVASAPTLEQAHKQVYEQIARIKCDNLFFRHDIGHWAL